MNDDFIIRDDPPPRHKKRGPRAQRRLLRWSKHAKARHDGRFIAFGTGWTKDDPYEDIR